jgi:threonine/homoserine/homoserine lactone efflux protein
MSFAIFLSALTFVSIATITPGPNNFMVFASGLNFGFKRTMPHMFGIAFGMAFLCFCVGYGLGKVLEIYPQVLWFIKVTGSAYMLYLAWKIANMGSLEMDENAVGKPFNFIEAALFQWVNPKSWIMGVNAMALFASQTSDDLGYYANVCIIAVLYFLVAFPSVMAWTSFGSIIQGLTQNPKVLRKINLSLAVLLVLSLWPMLT